MRMLQKTHTNVQVPHWNNTYLQAKYAEAIKGGNDEQCKKTAAHQALEKNTSW